MPTSKGCTDAGKVFGADILRGVQISIEAIATLPTEEQTLRTTIRAMLKTATATGLRGVPGVNLDDGHPAFLRFIGKKCLELRKTPRMETALGVRALLHPGTAPNVSQVLNHDGTARGGLLHKPLGKHMVMVSSLAQQFPAQLFEMSLSRAGAFCLKFATQAEDAAFLFLPAALSQEVTSRGDGGTVQAQVNANHLVSRCDGRVRNREDNMERKASFVVTQVSRTDLAADILLRVSWNVE